jgi:hypothetical protein
LEFRGHGYLSGSEIPTFLLAGIRDVAVFKIAVIDLNRLISPPRAMVSLMEMR